MFQFVFMFVRSCYVLKISESSCMSPCEGFLLTRKAMMKATLRHGFVCYELLVVFEVSYEVRSLLTGKSNLFFRMVHIYVVRSMKIYHHYDE